MNKLTTTQKDLFNKKQCYGNFCTLINPDYDHCNIDEALDEFEIRLLTRICNAKQYPEMKTQFQLRQ